MEDREKVARAIADAAEEEYETNWDAPDVHKQSQDYLLILADAALSAMQGDGWRQEVHTVLLNAAHELRATAPFIGGSGQVDMLAVADRCLALTLPELPAPPSAPGDEGEGA